VLLVVAALLPVVDPLGAAPVFLAMTPDADSATRAALARKVAFNGMVLLLAPMFLGNLVLRFFGVSVPVVQLAGGLIVCSFAWKVLGEADGGERPATASPEAIHAKAFYPFTLPLTVGPGAISVAVTLGANFPSTAQPFVADAVSSAAGILVVVGSIYLCYRHAQRMGDLLGRNGMAVVLRLSAFILFCIGVQIAWNGARSLALEVTVPAAVRPLDSSP
jgi:multiple antibiotic resistance protein